jgi:hypothetical protein
MYVYCKACKKRDKYERFPRGLFALIESGEDRRWRVYCKQTGWKYYDNGENNMTGVAS